MESLWFEDGAGHAQHYLSDSGGGGPWLLCLIEATLFWREVCSFLGFFRVLWGFSVVLWGY